MASPGISPQSRKPACPCPGALGEPSRQPWVCAPVSLCVFSERQPRAPSCGYANATPWPSSLRSPGVPLRHPRVSPGVRSPRASPRLSPLVARTCLPVVPRLVGRWSSSVSFGFLPLGYVYIIARPASLCNPRGDYFLNYFVSGSLNAAERSLLIPHLSLIEPQPSETWISSPQCSFAIKVE